MIVLSDTRNGIMTLTVNGQFDMQEAMTLATRLRYAAISPPERVHISLSDIKGSDRQAIDILIDSIYHLMEQVLYQASGQFISTRQPVIPVSS